MICGRGWLQEVTKANNESELIRGVQDRKTSYEVKVDIGLVSSEGHERTSVLHEIGEADQLRDQAAGANPISGQRLAEVVHHVLGSH